MRDIYSVFNSNGAYETGAHTHDEFMLMVPEHGRHARWAVDVAGLPSSGMLELEVTAAITPNAI